MVDLPIVTSDTTLSNSFLGGTIQICLVTRDLRRTMEGMVRAGIGPWRVYIFGPENISEATYRGQPGSFSAKVGLASSGTMGWEIVQPLTGPNIYEEFLEKHDEGIQHLAFNCNNIPWENRIRVFNEHGYEIIQSGVLHGQVRFAYFGTEKDTTTIIEILDIPEDFKLPEPEEWYLDRP